MKKTYIISSSLFLIFSVLLCGCTGEHSASQDHFFGQSSDCYITEAYNEETSSGTTPESSSSETAPETSSAGASAPCSSETGKNVTVDPALIPEPETVDTDTIERIERIDDKNLAFAFGTHHASGYCSGAEKLMQIEADYGISETVCGRIVYISCYNHTDKDIYVKGSRLIHTSDSGSTAAKVGISMGGVSPIDTSEFETGYYSFDVLFSTDVTATVSFCVDTDRTLACIVSVYDDSNNAASDCDKYRSRRELLQKAMKEAENSALGGGFASDGSRSLQLDKFYFPNYIFDDNEKFRCDTDKWAKIADELVESEWTDEYKAYVICQWMRENIAFDAYALIHGSRSSAYQDWSGKWSAYDTRTGVCWDFTNIYAIMCRSQGIPCTSVGSYEMGHMWNIVLLNGQWVEVDVSDYTEYYARHEDYTILEPHANSSWGQYAFTLMQPHDSALPEDICINLQLMYGDPTDKSESVHFLY